MLVPHHVVVARKVDGQSIPDVRFPVERLEFDPTASF
jgi:hypothetical protein